METTRNPAIRFPRRSQLSMLSGVALLDGLASERARPFPRSTIGVRLVAAARRDRRAHRGIAEAVRAVDFISLGIPLLAVGGSAALVAIGTATARRVAVRRGFVDRPGGHKGHAAPVALGGGVAVTAAATLPILLGVFVVRYLAAARPEWAPAALMTQVGGILHKTPAALAIVGAAWVLCVLGIFDDAKSLRPRTRLIVQVLVAAGLVLGFDIRLLSHWGLVPSAALSILWIVTLINSMNFLDNMDGLASGVAIIAASIFAAAAMLAGQIFVPTCCWLLVGALLGFLPFNWHPATIYMGDAGSTVIGLLLGVFTILTTFADPALGQRPFGVFAPLLVMAVPLYDTASVFYLRIRSGRPIWQGDRRHFSHRLVRRGLSVRQAVTAIWLATLVCAMPAVTLSHADWPTAIGEVVQTVLVVGLVALMEQAGGNGPTEA